MSEYSFIFHKEVSTDTDNAYFWYESQQVGLGERFLTDLYGKLTQIAIMPEAFGVKSRKNYREATLNNFPYVIVYKVFTRKQIIFISSVQHERRHPGKKYRKG